MLVYIFKADLWCRQCGDEICKELQTAGKAPADLEDDRSYDSDSYPKGPTEEGESDTPSHCAGCGLFLESSLTSDGREYVIEAVRSARQSGRPFHPHKSMPESKLYGGPGQYSRPSEEWADFYNIDSDVGEVDESEPDDDSGVEEVDESEPDDDSGVERTTE